MIKSWKQVCGGICNARNTLAQVSRLYDQNLLRNLSLRESAYLAEISTLAPFLTLFDAMSKVLMIKSCK